MSDMLQSGLAWLHEKRTAFMARTVTYRRGSSLEKEVSATAGVGRFDQIDEETGGIIRQIQTRDWIVNVADLSEFGKPESGDVVIDGEKKYQVNAIGGEPQFRIIDDGNAYRIHSLEVKA